MSLQVLALGIDNHSPAVVCWKIPKGNYSMNRIRVPPRRKKKETVRCHENTMQTHCLSKLQLNLHMHITLYVCICICIQKNWGRRQNQQEEIHTSRILWAFSTTPRILLFERPSFLSASRHWMCFSVNKATDVASNPENDALKSNKKSRKHLAIVI